jgi:predicted dehydrogenase
MDKVRIGFIGAGRFASWVHYPSLAEIEDVEISAICDLDEKRLSDMGDKYGVKNRFTDHRRMIEEIPLDAVYIIMQPQFLFEPAMDCLEKGLHLFVEKPPGLSASQTRQMAALAEKNGCKTMVGFNRRFAPLLVEARRIAEARGQLTQYVAEYYKNFLESADNPYNPQIPHSVLLYDGIHQVDFLRWMGGEVTEVKSSVDKVGKEYHNRFNALVRFDGGGEGVLLVNFVAGSRIERYEMHGQGISVLCEPPHSARVLEGTKEYAIRTSDLTGIDEALVSACKLKGDGVTHRAYGYLQENMHFIDCVKEDRVPVTNFGDAINTMELMSRIAGVKET